jgi:hypothetical protein
MKSPAPTLPIVLRCDDRLQPKLRYVFDTLLLAAGWKSAYVTDPPTSGPWVLYAPSSAPRTSDPRCLTVAHDPAAWRLFDGTSAAVSRTTVDGLPVVLPKGSPTDPSRESHVAFDLPANAFYFLSCWSERCDRDPAARRLYRDSVFRRLEIPQDIVDRYLHRLVDAVQRLRSRMGWPAWPERSWPGGRSYAVVLSHDVDYLARGRLDVLRQGSRTLARHLVKAREARDAASAGMALVRALVRGRDPYSDIRGLMACETRLGVRSSFQVAVARRHPRDVNYRIERPWVQDRLRAIVDGGFDLCLHGSYRSTEDPGWYVEEAALLERTLGRPRGSRQHFLAFDPDQLFAAQEQAGIEYDMSMGYPDRSGPRSGFSFPYFPYCLAQDRPYDVLQIGLGLMDVTLHTYMGLRGEAAWRSIAASLDDLRRKHGCTSVVWHPIVFGGARDPGLGELYWRLVRTVQDQGGWAVDGRQVNDFWRQEAGSHAGLLPSRPRSTSTAELAA